MTESNKSNLINEILNTLTGYAVIAVVVVIGLLIFNSCTGTDINIRPPCTVCEEIAINYPLEESLICKYLKDPCIANDVIVTVATAGVIWEHWKVEDLKKWIETTRGFILGGTNYAALNAYVTKFISEYNKKMGATYLLLANILLKFDSTVAISSPDVALLMKALNNLEIQANMLI